MVKKVASAPLTVADSVTRSHFTCRLRSDLINEVRKQSINLNCSQGILFEVMIAKSITSGLISRRDIFAYSSDPKWLQNLIADSIERLGNVADSMDAASIAQLTKLLDRVTPPKKP